MDPNVLFCAEHRTSMMGKGMTELLLLAAAAAGNDTKQLSKSAKYRQRQNAKKEAPPPASPNVLFVPNMKPGTTEEQLQQVFR